jgi:mono/diheme cytochrome c family protein
MEEGDEAAFVAGAGPCGFSYHPLLGRRTAQEAVVGAGRQAGRGARTHESLASPENVAQGKAIYNGKGACFRCHGKDGDGNGPLAARLNPSPRNFQDHGFWSQRTEGEVFWLIKNGSPDTGIVGYGDQLTDGEIWALIQYIRSFTGEHGPA